MPDTHICCLSTLHSRLPVPAFYCRNVRDLHFRCPPLDREKDVLISMCGSLDIQLKNVEDSRVYVRFSSSRDFLANHYLIIRITPLNMMISL